MSTSRNHHFVSQVHIKNFFNSEKGKIFLFDKLQNNPYFKTTSKSLFSERDLNSKFDHGDLDHISLEKDLNEHFEQDFSKHLKTVQRFLVELNLTNNVEEALFYFAKYGIIGEVRNPRHKRNLEETLHNAYSEIFKMSDDNLKKQFDKAFTYKDETKYLNAVQYSKFADEAIKQMGNLTFRIEIPKNDDDYFLLPDFCAANRREQINTYFNPDIKEIAYIGLPLTSKIYVHFYSSKIKGISPHSGIFELSNSRVYNLNKLNYDFCESKVACESQEYLQSFIKRIAQHQSQIHRSV